MRSLLPRSLAILALAAFALAGAAGSASAEQATSASAGFMGGVNVSAAAAGSTLAEADHMIAAARAVHAKIVRSEVPWSVFEPNGPESIAPRPLAFIDRLVRDASAAHIRVILTVESTPCWASSAPSALLAKCKPGQESAANAWPPTVVGEYATFTAFLARRYGTKLAAIEIWNEPDQANEDYFAGPNKPARYAAVLRAAYPAIKAANPAVPVLAGSLVGSNGVFLRALYAAGIKGYYDGLAVHFYNLTVASLRSIREVQIANGDTTPLWLAEFGWSSCLAHRKIEQDQACVSPATQALNLENALRELARTPYVAAAAIYKLQDSAAEEFGLLSRGGARKPAFKAVERALLSPFGAISPVTLSLRSGGSHLIASGTAPVGDFMELEAFQGATLRYRALFTLNRFNSYSLSLPSALGTSGLRVRVFQYRTGPSGAAQKSV